MIFGTYYVITIAFVDLSFTRRQILWWYW